MDIKVILAIALPWILLGSGIVYFITSKKNWKDKIGELVFKIIEKVKDGDLTWNEAYNLIKWIFSKEPTEAEVQAKLKK